jgi:hypothetical protein
VIRDEKRKPHLRLAFASEEGGVVVVVSKATPGSCFQARGVGVGTGQRFVVIK